MNQKKNPMKNPMKIQMKNQMMTQMNRNPHLKPKIRRYKMKRICCRKMNYYRNPMNTLNCFQNFAWLE
jgi:hypothetical protein